MASPKHNKKLMERSIKLRRNPNQARHVLGNDTVPVQLALEAPTPQLALEASAPQQPKFEAPETVAEVTAEMPPPPVAEDGLFLLPPSGQPRVSEEAQFVEDVVPETPVADEPAAFLPAETEPDDDEQPTFYVPVDEDQILAEQEWVPSDGPAPVHSVFTPNDLGDAERTPGDVWEDTAYRGDAEADDASPFFGVDTLPAALPVAESEPEPVAAAEPVAPEPVTVVEPEPAAVEPEPSVQPAPVTLVDPEPAFTEPEPETAVELEPAVEPVAAAEPEPATTTPEDSFLGNGDFDAPVYIAPYVAPVVEAPAPAQVVIQPVIQPVIYQVPVYGGVAEEDDGSAPVEYISAPAAPAAPSAPSDSSGFSIDKPNAPTIDQGPALEIIAPPVKDPFFVWNGKPIGGKAIPAGGGKSSVVSISSPNPKKVPRKKAAQATGGIDEQTWLGEVVQRALVAGASDVHMSLTGDKTFLNVRVRIDGQMRVFDSLTGESAQKVMGIFKAGAEFASGGSYVPEEAIYSVDVEGESRKARAVLFRAQDGGDALVMRLPPMGEIRRLEELEFSPQNLALFKKLLLSANRMLLIAGPMGSGKTTTSHAALMQVATTDRSVWTVEDPVERFLPGLTQLEVDDENGAGFDKLLPSLVRADYDTLFLGEIRDKATAAAGVRQAKAGRQVISTIHSNDNVTAVLRLIELAEDTPLSVMDAIKGVVSQRLVRRLNKEWDGNPETKYKGRVPIHEVLMMNNDLVEAVMEQRPLSEIKRVAAAASASTFAEDGARLIAANITDAEEVRKVLGE